MTDSATVDLAQDAAVEAPVQVIPPPAGAELPVLGRDHIVEPTSPPADTALGAGAAALLDGLLAWHNRMPWARRLQPEQVGQAGVVRFAFEPPQGASGEAVLLAPMFQLEKLVDGQSAKQLLAFVRRHGFEASPAPSDWPLRELETGGADTKAVHWRYLLTAAYPAAYGATPLRALMGQPGVPGGKVPVAGRRSLSLLRVGVAAALAALLAAVAAWALYKPAARAEAVPQAAPAASAASAPVASAVEAANVTSTAASAIGAEARAASAEVPATHDGSATAAAVAEPAVAASAPLVKSAAEGVPAPIEGAVARAASVGDSPHGPQAEAAADQAATTPTRTKAEPVAHRAQPEVVPEASTDHHAGAEESAAPARVPPKPLPTIRPIHATPATYQAPEAKAVPEPAVSAGPHFALITAVSPTPQALVQLRRRLRQAMGREGESLQLELQAAPGGQVLALWPMASRSDAARLADTLRQAGVNMRVVEF